MLHDLFQSTHPSGVRLFRMILSIRRINLNPRTPVGCDGIRSLARLFSYIFQSTHPSGVRRPSTRRASPTRHFNPRTPVGCDVPVLVLACIGDRISIHAPQWGATTRVKYPNPSPRISIHAPQWGATKWALQISNNANISIHAPQWGATGHLSGFGARQVISIHAPQWGATYCWPLGVTFVVFQSTHPSGVRLNEHGYRARSMRFQSTHPSGVRRVENQRGIHRHDFNPRTPVGCDLVLLPVRLLDDISIHAPQWGATEITAVRSRVFKFQSTHPSGVRPVRVAQEPLVEAISIHAPQWGATCGGSTATCAKS